MNWDISIGRGKQLYGRILQKVGQHLGQRTMVLDGESAEYSGRLQMRYGWLKHQEQWGAHFARIPRQATPTIRETGARLGATERATY